MLKDNEESHLDQYRTIQDKIYELRKLYNPEVNKERERLFNELDIIWSLLSSEELQTIEEEHQWSKKLDSVLFLSLANLPTLDRNGMRFLKILVIKSL